MNIYRKEPLIEMLPKIKLKRSYGKENIAH